MTIAMVVAFALLALAGRWQWARYEEKRALAGEPVAEMTLVAYEPIEEGVQLVYGVAPGGVAGWRVFAPVRYGEDVIFIDADFIPDLQPPDWREVRYPASLSFDTPVAGAPLRPALRPALAPPDRPLQRLWFHPDLAAMGRAAGLEPVADYYLATDYLAEDGRAQENPFARPAGADPLPPERHMGYAFTWWGLAAALLGVYFAYHISVGRLTWARRRDDDSEPL